MGKAASCLAVFCLFLIHVAYSLINAATSLRKLCPARNPQPLTAKRRQLPSHLAILFACDNDDSFERFEGDFLANVEQIISWCRSVGIKQLTIYDRQGILARSIYSLRTRLQPKTAEEGYTSASESEIEYPLTPPLSDDASSRPLSPEADVCDVPLKLHVTTLRLQNAEHPSENSKKRLGVKTLTRRPHYRELETPEAPLSVHVISRQSGKVAMANVATLLARQHQSSKHSAPHDFSLAQNELNLLLEGKYGFPSPELMLIHHVLPHRTARNVLELHGFPPWQVRLTEFYYDQYPSSTWTRWRHLLSNPPYIPLDERKFRRALDEYASAEMRLGK